MNVLCVPMVLDVAVPGHIFNPIASIDANHAILQGCLLLAFWCESSSSSFCCLFSIVLQVLGSFPAEAILAPGCVDAGFNC